MSRKVLSSKVLTRKTLTRNFLSLKALSRKTLTRKVLFRKSWNIDQCHGGQNLLAHPVTQWWLIVAAICNFYILFREKNAQSKEKMHNFEAFGTLIEFVI